MKPMRRDVLQALEELWSVYPHWRFAQLVCNVAGWADVDAWDIEDAQLLAAIRDQQEYQRSSSVSSQHVNPS